MCFINAGQLEGIGVWSAGLCPVASLRCFDFFKKERAAGMVPAALNLISRLWLP
ncbi:hypothetical protein ROS1_58730 [Roseibium sp. ROS1]